MGFWLVRVGLWIVGWVRELTWIVGRLVDWVVDCGLVKLGWSGLDGLALAVAYGLVRVGCGLGWVGLARVKF